MNEKEELKAGIWKTKDKKKQTDEGRRINCGGKGGENREGRE
jgi:hypothetical protein